MTPLVLASASPRRKDLLSRLGMPFTVLPSDIDEPLPSSSSPAIVAGTLARTKAEAARLVEAGAAIVAADTVVVVDRAILGKPVDSQQARQMLQLLRGKPHQVLTAVAVMPAGRRSALARHPTTSVQMRHYTDAEIAASIERGDPFDKAGGYAIQDDLLQPVESYEGCYCNVVGLSLWTTIELLRKSGVDVTAVDPARLLPQCAACPLAPPDLALTAL